MDYRAEHILLYLGNGMDAAEKEAFEAACRNDQELQAQLDTCRESLDYYREEQAFAAEKDSLRRLTTDLNKKYFAAEAPAPKVKLRPNRNVLAMAAALALLVFAGFYWLYTPDPLQAYGSIPRVAITERGTPADQDKIALAERINNRDYAEALPLAKKIVYADSAQVSYQLYYGLCLLHTRAYDEARHWLQKVSSGNSLMKYQATLLTGLSYQQQNRKEECIRTLEQIPADAAEYPKAQALLKRVR